MRRGDSYSLMAEMAWKVDPNVDAARKLPKWARFHRACGERVLFFDNIERRDRRDTYKCVAFTIEERTTGKFAGHPHQVFLAEGIGKTVLDALSDALTKSGYDIPEAADLLAAGLQDTGCTSEELAEIDPIHPEFEERVAAIGGDFDALLDDEFEGLL